MKKLFLTCALAVSSVAAFSQTHSDSSLNLMSKMQLANVYLEQVSQLAFSTPYTAFTLTCNDTTSKDLDIPTSKYVKRKQEEVLEISSMYSETMKIQLYEIIPYSDKRDIINAILYLQEVNSNLKKK